MSRPSVPSEAWFRAARQPSPVYFPPMFSRKFTTAAGLTRAEWRWAARALPWLLAARLGLATLGYKRTRDILSPGECTNNGRPSNQVAGASHSTPTPAWRAIVRGVDIAARNQPRPATCLPRALVLHRLLSQAGCPSELNVGVRRSGEALDGHAWVTVAGEPIGETAGLPDRYLPIRGALR